MGRDVLYAGGFAAPRWKNDAEEIRASKIDNGWHPSTVDFKATAEASGGGTAVSSLSDLLNYLRSKPDGSVEELILIGHANPRGFALGGTIGMPQRDQPADVDFDPAQTIRSTDLTANAISIGAVKIKFAKNAKIVLAGCDAGLASILLNQFANAFGVCVLGFSDRVWTGFKVKGNPPSISSRGHVYFDSSGLMAAGLGPDVGSWPKDVGKLAPDRKSDNCP